MRRKTIGRERALFPAALAVTLAVSACGDLFNVTNPGQIMDEDLHDSAMIETLVTGMSADFSVAVASVAVAGAAMSDEMEGSSNFVWVREYSRGIASPEFDLVRWADVQRARWVAESGIERIEELLGPEAQDDPNLIRARVFAGLSNRLLGENFCEVTFDGGPALPRDSAFQRGVAHFTEAIRLAQAAGDEALLLAAYGGRAQSYLGLGDWTAAAADAARVPTDFVYSAVFGANTGRENNDVWTVGGWQDADISAIGSLPATLPEEDPRTPWTDCTNGGCARTVGGDGTTPLLRQDKFPDRGADIPVVKGSEMRLIEAEALLHSGDVQGAMARMNEARALAELGPLSASTSEEAFAHLDRERLLTLWLEGRRLHDLDRWDHPFLDGGYLFHEWNQPRAACWGFGLNECQTNPNLQCS